MFYYLAIGLIAILSGVHFCARFFVTNTIAFSSTLSTGKVSITLRTVTLGIRKVFGSPTLIPYHFVPLPFWERVIFLYLGHISRHYSDQLFLPYCCVQGGPGAESVEKISQTQYRGINYSKRKTIVLFWAATLFKLLLLLLLLFELFKFALRLFSWTKITMFACRAVCWLQPNQIAV